MHKPLNGFSSLLLLIVFYHYYHHAHNHVFFYYIITSTILHVFSHWYSHSRLVFFFLSPFLVLFQSARCRLKVEECRKIKETGCIKGIVVKEKRLFRLHEDPITPNHTTRHVIWIGKT